MVPIADSNDFYTKTTGLSSFYSSSSTGTEPNMRQELIKMFDGTYPEIAKAQTGLLRKMRRDSNGDLIECECVDSVTREPDKDRFCPICFGEGYMWDEDTLEFYQTYQQSDSQNVSKDKLQKPGLINQPFVVFYCRYDAEITKEDKIVELDLDLDGSVSDPMSRRRIFRISRVWEYRSDNGKLEYFKVFCYYDNVKYLNAPSYGE